ncbi:MAG: hypothetical protein K6F87_03205 [Lachnospiraceae bacterium]|nr:hypothetical protein [Lachnospiraceae bacterium]
MKSSRGTDLLRKTALLFVLIVSLAGLCGCGVSDMIDEANEGNAPGNNAIKVIDANGDEIETSVSVIDESEAEDNESAPLPASNLALAAQNFTFSENENFAYNQLSESGKTCYREIYAIISDMLEGVELSSRDTDEVDLAFRAVMLDHPEIFYVKGYSIKKYMNGNDLKKIVFSGTYTMSKGAADSARERVEAYVDDFISRAPEDGDDYDKIKYVYDRLIRTNEYVPDSENNQNILSVVDNGRTVCQGYTKAMQLILNRMGIFCTLVNGTACGQNGVPDANDLKNAANAEWGGHVWNIIKCNGMYYNCDVTWGDAVITLMSDDGSLSRDIDINYEFFLVDDAALMDSHKPEPVVTMPRCNSMEDSFYRHEGLYFTDIDSDQFYRAFENAYANGETYLYLKASDSYVFDKIKSHLFDDQNIFKYMGRTNVKYVDFSDRNLIMISL